MLLDLRLSYVYCLKIDTPAPPPPPPSPCYLNSSPQTHGKSPASYLRLQSYKFEPPWPAVFSSLNRVRLYPPTHSFIAEMKSGRPGRHCPAQGQVEDSTRQIRSLRDESRAAPAEAPTWVPVAHTVVYSHL